MNYELEDYPTFEPIKTKPTKRIAEKKLKKKLAIPLSDIEKAVWQYIIDHATPHKYGYAVSFLAVSKEDFFKRVEARRNGTFKRQDIEVIANKVNIVRRKAVWNQKRSDLFNKAKKEGPWWLKVMIKLRQKLSILVERQLKRLEN